MSGCKSEDEIATQLKILILRFILNQNTDQIEDMAAELRSVLPFTSPQIFIDYIFAHLNGDLFELSENKTEFFPASNFPKGV
jgi:hypothetical protein